MYRMYLIETLQGGIILYHISVLHVVIHRINVAGVYAYYCMLWHWCS